MTTTKFVSPADSARAGALARSRTAGGGGGSDRQPGQPTPTRGAILARAGIAPIAGLPALPGVGGGWGGWGGRDAGGGAMFTGTVIDTGTAFLAPSATYARSSGGWGGGGGLYITDGGQSNILPPPPMDGFYGVSWSGLGGWGYAQDVQAASFERIRAYSRWLERNVSIVRAAIQRLDALAMRDGPTLQVATGDPKFDRWLEKAWERFGASPKMGGFEGACVDLARRWTYDELRSACFRAAFVDGDIVPHFTADAEKRPALQVIPGDHVGGGGGAKDRRDGLVIDPTTGRITGFKVRTVDADGKTGSATIKAEDAVLLRWPLHERAEHLRGEPALAAAVETLFTIDLSDAAVHQAVINAAAYGIFITTEHPEDGPPAGVLDPSGSGDASGAGGGAESIGLEHGSGLNQTPVTPGAITHLGVGEAVQTTQAAQPGGNYGGFVRTLHMTLTSDLGIAGDLVTLNAEHGNYSAQRTNVSLSWMTAMRLQAWIEHHLDWPTLAHFVKWLISREGFVPPSPGTTEEEGVVDLAEVPTEKAALLQWILERSSFAQPLQPSLDPEREVRTYVEAVNNLLMDRDEATIRLTGRTFEQTILKLAAQKKRMDQLGLQPVSLPGAGVPNGQSSNGQSANEEETGGQSS